MQAFGTLTGLANNTQVDSRNETECISNTIPKQINKNSVL